LIFIIPIAITHLFYIYIALIMSFLIELTEDELNDLIDAVKQKKDLFDLITAKKQDILNERKRNYENVKLRELKLERQMNDILSKCYGIMLHHYNYIENIKNHYLAIQPVWFNRNYEMVIKHLEEINKINKEEFEIATQNLSDVEKFDESLQENYIKCNKICSDFYRKYTLLIQKVIRELSELKLYLRKYSAEELKCLSFENNFHELYDKVTGCDKRSITLGEQFRCMLTREELGDYAPRNDHRD
jgi:hypothetical protein